jgi:hypothetical protein
MLTEKPSENNMVGFSQSQGERGGLAVTRPISFLKPPSSS